MVSKQPYVFNGIVGVAPVEVLFHYDSVLVVNDHAANSVYYSTDGSNYQELKPTEAVALDKLCSSYSFKYYGSGVGTTLRFTLWKQA